MRKLTKIGGVILLLTLLVSLMIGAIPASAATLAWSEVKTPQTISSQLVADSSIDVFAVGPDGNTMFAYDNDANKMYKSTNAGKTWTSKDIGDDIEGAGDDVVAMAISRSYANDESVVVVTEDTVWRTINGGKDFGDVGSANLMAMVGANAVITSVDTATHYLGGQAILVGIADPTGAWGGVFRYTTSSLSWKDLEVGNKDVLAVAFSPNHQADAGYLAVVTNGEDTHLSYKFGDDDWNSGILDARLINGTMTTDCPTGAAIAFPEDYEWSSNNYVFVGTRGATTPTAEPGNDVYRIEGALPGGTSKSTDLDAGGNDSATDIYSVAFKGPVADGVLLAGRTNSNTVRRTSNPLDSAPSWKGNSKSPTGAGNFTVAFSPTKDDAYATSTGNGSAFSKSTDKGATWNQMSLISVSDTSNGDPGECALTIADIAVIDANTIYMIMADDGDLTSLFKTTDGGGSWERIWYQADMMTLEPSPEYATDNTLFIATSGTRIWKTSNAGQTFIGLTAPEDITAIAAVDGSTYYTGHDGVFYKSGRWTEATIHGVATSIVITPNDEILVGTDDGDVDVSTNDGKKFDRVGDDDALGNGADVYLAISANYASNHYIFGGSSDNGIMRYEMGSTSPWKSLTTGTILTASSDISDIAVSPDDTLYAGSPDAGVGLYRSVSPSGPLGKQGFVKVAEDYPNSDTIITGGLNVVEGSNILYVIADIDASDNNDLRGNYGYEYRILVFDDTVTSAVTLSAPKNNAVTAGSGKVTFSWSEVDAPVDIVYELQVALDVNFDNKYGTYTTEGTSYTVTGMSAGTDYWWRVRVTTVSGDSLPSKFSAKWKFQPQIATPDLEAPLPGEMYAGIQPNFQWTAVAGADSYELYVADNPFYANAEARKPLTHNVYQWNGELEMGKTYYWYVVAIKGSNTSKPAEGVFTVNEDPNVTAADIIAGSQPTVNVPPAPTQAPPTVNVAPATVIVPEQKAEQVSPPFIWAIIIIGAILVIAVIVLIVRTRRVS